jgi:hypothetical protein
MKTIVYILSFVIACTFLGCAPVVHTYDRNTGKWSTQHFTKWGGDPVFLSQIDDDIKRESENAPLLYGTWREYWIDRCERLHYYESPDEPPGIAEHYIEYIISKRREAGLPDIPEIDKRQFRSLWQNWTDAVDEQLSMEAKGLPPLTIFNIKQWEKTKTWPEYWKVFEENLLNDHLDIDRAIFTNGAEYINNRRKQMGLPPLN